MLSFLGSVGEGEGGGELHLRGSSSFLQCKFIVDTRLLHTTRVPSLRSRFDFALFACEAVNGIEVGS